MIGWFTRLDAMAKSIATILVLAALLAVLMAVLTMCGSREKVQQAERGERIATATSDALDKVATETPAIRQDQKEKQDEVDQIQGADQRLPDGFGADLERVRRGQRHPDPR